MELVEGKTLRLLLGGGPLPISDALRIACGIAAGLDGAHRAGVIHRDLKPENVMIRPDGSVKILDFGLARLLDVRAETGRPGISQQETASEQLTRAGQILGTYAYMSPEQARGRAVDARSDLFTFGTVLYEMVTGRRPFHGQNQNDLLGAIVRDRQPDARRLNARVPREFDAIIRRCLEKDPARRFPSAADIKAGLDRLQSSRSPGGIALKEIFGRRWWAAAAALVLLSAVIGFGVVQWREKVLGVQGRAPIASLAILPFINEENGTGTDFLTDGMSESLINTLSRLPHLKVIARASVFHYKGRTDDPRRIGSELGVAALLISRLRWRGDEVAIASELVDARDGSLLWSERYAQPLADLQHVVGEIADRVVEGLGLELSQEEKARLNKPQTHDARAYEAYLQARYLLNRFTRQDYLRAEPLLKRALELDPRYAPAWVGLAYHYYAASNLYAPPSEVMPKAKDAAARALAIDPAFAEAHTALGLVSAQYEWNWDTAGRQLRTGAELMPGSAAAHHWYAIYLAEIGRLDEGVAEIRRALELDPLSTYILTDAALLLFLNQRYDDAIARGRRAIEMEPAAAPAHALLGVVLHAQGRASEGLAELEAAHRIDDNAELAGWLGYVYGVEKRTPQARALLDAMLHRSDAFVPAHSIAMVYAGLGDADSVFTWLQRAYADRSEGICWIKVDPRLSTLRHDRRFHDLIRRVGLE